MKPIAFAMLLAVSISACKQKEAEEQSKSASTAKTANAGATKGDEGDPAACANLQNAVACSDRAVKNAGKTYAWKVTKAGSYSFTVTPTGKSKTMRLWPKLIVTKGDEEIVSETAAEELKASAQIEKGDYSITVKDADDTHIETIADGAGFKLAIALDK